MLLFSLSRRATSSVSDSQRCPVGVDVFPEGVVRGVDVFPEGVLRDVDVEGGAEAVSSRGLEGGVSM